MRKKCDILICCCSGIGETFSRDLLGRLLHAGYHAALYLDKPDDEAVRNAKDFLIVLSPGSLEPGNDVFLGSVERAVRSGANVIPLKLEGFERPSKGTLPTQIREILDFEDVSFTNDHFHGSVKKLCKRFLISRKHLDRRIACAVFICAAIFVAGMLSYLHTKVIPAFSLYVSYDEKAGGISDSPFKYWRKNYYFEKKGGDVRSMDVTPAAVLEIIINAPSDGAGRRMGAVRIGLDNYFEDLDDGGSYDDRAFIPENNAELVKECLPELADCLRKHGMTLFMYSMKVYFTVTYKDVFGITHSKLYEPDFNYDYVYTQLDKETGEYLFLRSTSDPTLYEGKSIEEAYGKLTIAKTKKQMLDRIGRLAQDISNDRAKLLDKDCNAIDNGDGTDTMDPYYAFLTFTVKYRNDIFTWFHAEHKDCALRKDYVQQ